MLFCGDVGGQSGAIEVWRNDPRVSTDLKLLDGVYGGHDADFEAASHETFLPRGSGLPGLAWQRQASAFIDGLPDSSKFVRADEAKTTGIRQGLAFPCPVPSNENFVLAFLSEPAMPIAARIESWVPDADGLSLKRGPGFGVSGKTTVVPAAATDDTGRAILEAFAGGVPTVRPAAPGELAGALIALPVLSDGVVVETVAMYF